MIYRRRDIIYIGIPLYQVRRGVKKGPASFGSRPLRDFIKLHVEGFHARDGVVYFARELEQLLGIHGAGGLVGDHVGEVFDAVQLKCDSIRFLCTF